MYKKTVLTILIGICSLVSWGQKAGEYTNNHKKNMKTLDALVKSYRTIPNYYIYFTNVGCLYEIRVNDILKAKIWEEGHSGGTSTPINSAILCSGRQRVSVRLYPEPGDSLITSIEPFTLKIGYKDFAEESPRPWHWVWEMPTIEMPEGGVPYYEFEGEFEATVPRVVTGWSDCIDLRNIPDIEQRVVEKFKEIRELMKSKKIEQLTELLAYKRFDIAKAFHETSRELDWKLRGLNRELEEAYPEDWQEIEDYELVFYADGRLATLESKKEGGYKSALLRIWEEDIDEKYYYLRAVVYEMRLGIRKGTDELIPIR